MMRGRQAPTTSTGKGSKKSMTPSSTSTGKGRKKHIAPPSPPKHSSDSDTDSHHSEVVVVSRSSSRSTSRSASRSSSRPTRQITAREVSGALQSVDVTGDKGKEPRKKRPAVAITEAQEATALDFLKSHPVLYDRSMKEYKDVPLKENMWEELADKLTTKRNPIKTDDIKKWFESQRTIYGKSTKMVAGQSGKRLSDRKRWVIIEFGFLAGHISRHGTVDSPLKNIVVAEAAARHGTVDSPVKDIVVAEAASQVHIVDTDDTRAGPSQSEKRRRVVSPACEVRQNVLQPVLPDHRRAFCEFIAASMKDIDESLWDNYSTDAFRVLTDYKSRSRALLLPPPAVPQVKLVQVTRPAATSTPTFPHYGPTQTQQRTSGKPSPPKYVSVNPGAVAGGSGTAAHNSSAGSIGLLVAEYSELDVPQSIAQIKTPSPLDEEEKDDQ